MSQTFAGGTNLPTKRASQILTGDIERQSIFQFNKTEKCFAFSALLQPQFSPNEDGLVGFLFHGLLYLTEQHQLQMFVRLSCVKLNMLTRCKFR